MEKFMDIDLEEMFRQKVLLCDLSGRARLHGYWNLADELNGILGVLDAVQDAAGFYMPEFDINTGKFCDEQYNHVLDKVLAEDDMDFNEEGE